MLNFPIEESSTLNASLRITAYTEIVIIDDMYEEYYPTRLAADLTIDEALVFTVTYNDYGDPFSGDISLSLVPYTFSLIFDDAQTTSASLEASISENDKVIVGVDVVVNIETTKKENVKSVAGNVIYGAIEVKGNISIPEEESEDSDINDFINLQIHQNGNKIGDIVIVEEQVGGDTEGVPYIKYNDGTTESLEDLFEETVMEVENFLDDLDEWGG